LADLTRTYVNGEFISFGLEISLSTQAPHPCLDRDAGLTGLFALYASSVDEHAGVCAWANAANADFLQLQRAFRRLLAEA
jgi:hypothetical protein